MKKLLPFLLLLAFACASSTTTGQKALEIQIEQLPDTGFAVQSRGATSIAYQMTVRNHSDSAVTLKSIEMRTVGRSPYTLRNEPAALSETIDPGKDATVTFSLWSYEGEKQKAATVWVNGTLHYTNRTGDASQSFEQSFRVP